jgi:NAD(P)-dependent dehydrogenase (short-subunit alcohol dehydrogenase family)
VGLVIAINLSAAFACRAVLRGMMKKRWGRIFKSPLVGATGNQARAITRRQGGLVGMTKSLAAELPRNITANAVAPGFIRLPWMSDR